MENLRNFVLSCTKCDLFKTRAKVVFGDGDYTSRVMFIGEAPGKNEDLTGLPFVGRAGKLLDEALTLNGICREDVFITNILKCRPPNNRNPKEEEVKACKNWLYNQIAIINPILIVLIGGVAVSSFLGIKVGISKLRGKIFNIKNTLIVPVYHPAYILRNSSKKSVFLKDMELVSNLIKEIKDANFSSLL